MKTFMYVVHGFFAMTLLLVLVVLPLAPVFAAEPTEAASVSEEPVPTPPQPDSIDVVEVSSIEQPASDVDTSAIPLESAVSPTEIIPPSEPENIQSEIVDAEEEAPVEEASTAIDATQDNSENPEIENITDSATDAPIPAETSSTNTPVDAETDAEGEVAAPDQNDTEVIPENTSDTVNIPDTPVTSHSVDTPADSQADTDEATSSEQVVLQPTVVDAMQNTLTTDDNRFTFSKSECTSVGGGTYYCTDATNTPTVTYTDRVFSAIDVEGDKEIFIEKEGTITQITSNQYDDDAPYYDELSNTIVWQRLIDGRYQIILYDVVSGSETQLTNDRYNNMAPNRFGDIIVWQGWVGNDWEIFMLSGDELTMLTDNTTHDITPSVNGDYIVWQSFESGAWKMKVYDIRTKQIQTIEDSEGGSIENPRFVLMYDTKYETGDVETRGFDLKSGEVVPLGAKTAPVPTQIPDPDQTGEERALLITPTAPVKTKVESESDGTDGGPVPPSDDTAVTPGDIVIPVFDGGATSTASTTLTAPAGTTTEAIDDIIIPSPDTESTSTSTDHISDLIVTPFVEPIDVGLDSQIGVASST